MNSLMFKQINPSATFDANVKSIKEIDAEIEFKYLTGTANQSNIFPLLEKKDLLENENLMISEMYFQ